MKCDHCDNEATVHELAVRNGVKVERHLCEQCAGQQGISVSSTSPIHELLKTFSVQAGLPTPPHGPTPKPTLRANTCPTCRTTLSDFKQHGLLGCADCYKAFEAQLFPLLERAHDGGVHHTGKQPHRLMASAPTPADPPVAPTASGSEPAQSPVTAPVAPPPVAPPPVPTSEEIARRAANIQRQLEKAIAEERYEAAAKLRDQLRALRPSDPTA